VRVLIALLCRTSFYDLAETSTHCCSILCAEKQVLLKFISAMELSSKCAVCITSKGGANKSASSAT
jgi:hypothetical protein